MDLIGNVDSAGVTAGANVGGRFIAKELDNGTCFHMGSREGCVGELSSVLVMETSENTRDKLTPRELYRVCVFDFLGVDGVLLRL